MPFYITCQVNSKRFSVHSEGERLFMLGETGERAMIDLATPKQIERPSEGKPFTNEVTQPPAPELPSPSPPTTLSNADLQYEVEPPRGESPLDDDLLQLDHRSAFNKLRAEIIVSGDRNPDAASVAQACQQKRQSTSDFQLRFPRPESDRLDPYLSTCSSDDRRVCHRRIFI